MSSKQVVCKASVDNGKEIRKFTFQDSTQINFTELRSKLATLFSLASFRIRYKDSKGHYTVIQDEQELRRALSDILISHNDLDKVIMRLVLDKTTTKADNEPRNVFKAEEQPAGDEGTRKRNYETPALDRVLNGIHDIVETFVNQLGTNTERNLAQDLANLNTKNTRSEEDVTQQVTDTLSEGGLNASPRTSIRPSSPVTKNLREDPRAPVHHGVICDCCGQTIQGIRWKCRTCPDYDLCHACKPKTDIHKHDSDHAFEDMQYPVGRIPRTSHSHNAVCDYCDVVIVGTRHKCIQCPDFDLCNNCIELARIEHPTHTFMPISRPGEPEIKIPDAVHHPGIRCDGCGNNINGARYKCGNCPDFDLCGNCEASPFYNHDPDHVLLKIKRPVVNPVLARTALLPNFYARSDLRTTRPKSFMERNDRRPSVQEVASQTNHEAIDSLTVTATRETNEGSQSETIPTSAASIASQSCEFSPSTSRASVEDERPPSRAPIALYEPVPLGTQTLQSLPKLETNPVEDQTLLQSCLSRVETSSVEAETSQSSLSSLGTESVKTETLQSSLPDLKATPRSPEFGSTLIDESVDVLPMVSETLKAGFIEDVNDFKDKPLAAQAQFLKTWRMQNIGDVAWPKTTVLKYVGGEGSAHMFDESLIGSDGPEFPVGMVQPGEFAEVTADLQAPAEPGNYSSYWRLNDGDGSFIGSRIWCSIIVQAADETSSLASSLMIFPRLAQSSTETVSSSVPTSVYQSDIDGLDIDTENGGSAFHEPALRTATTTDLESQPMSLSVPPESEVFDSSEMDSDVDSLSDASSYDFVDSDEDNQA